MIGILFLAGCADYPADLNGKPLDKAISLYGEPEGAVDNNGAREFFFPAKNQDAQKQQRIKALLNPDMPIMQTNFKPSSCTYIMDALWTGAYKEWIIHSVSKSPQCGEVN